MTKKYTSLPVAFLVLSVLQATVSVGSDKYYRWTDNSGVTQISDRPPPQGIAFEEGVMGSGSNFIGREENRVGASSDSQNSNKPMMATGENPGSAPEFVKDPVLCNSARQSLEVLENFIRIRVQDPDGSYRILSPDEREAERAKALSAIELNCD